MHEPWHVATVLVKRKSISAHLKFQVGLFQAATIGLTQQFSVTVMIISGIPSPVELFLEKKIVDCPKYVLIKSRMSLYMTSLSLSSIVDPLYTR